jgi:hypothetical protein
MVYDGFAGWTVGIQVLAWIRNFSVLQSVQTDCEVHRASYPIGTGVDFPEGKAVGP